MQMNKVTQYLQLDYVTISPLFKRMEKMVDLGENVFQTINENILN